jgi:hypothetical protein
LLDGPKTVRQYLTEQIKSKKTPKMKKTLLILALAAGFASAKADTYNIGDGNSLYLGFFAADEVSTRSVIVNLGRADDVFSGITLDQSGLASVLSTTYGASWYNNSQVYYSLFGYKGGYGEYGNVFAARSSTSAPLQTSVMGRTSIIEDSYWYFSDNMNAVLGAHQSNGSERSYVIGSTGHSHEFSVVDNSAVTFSGMADGSWGIFTSPVTAQVTGNLSIQEYANDGFGTFVSAQSGPSTAAYVQTTGGVISVPEPSTYALMGIAALLFVVAYRRRTA